MEFVWHVQAIAKLAHRMDVYCAKKDFIWLIMLLNVFHVRHFVGHVQWLVYAICVSQEHTYIIVNVYHVWCQIVTTALYTTSKMRLNSVLCASMGIFLAKSWINAFLACKIVRYAPMILFAKNALKATIFKLAIA